MGPSATCQPILTALRQSVRNGVVAVEIDSTTVTADVHDRDAMC